MRSWLQAATLLLAAGSAFALPHPRHARNDVATVAGSIGPDTVSIQFSTPCDECFVDTKDGVELELKVDASKHECDISGVYLNGRSLVPQGGGHFNKGNIAFTTKSVRQPSEVEVVASWSFTCLNNEVSLLSVTLNNKIDEDESAKPSGFAVSFKQRKQPVLLRLQTQPVRDADASDVHEEWVNVSPEFQLIVVPPSLEGEIRILEEIEVQIGQLVHQYLHQEHRIAKMIKHDFRACHGIKCMLQTAMRKAPDAFALLKAHFHHPHKKAHGNSPTVEELPMHVGHGDMQDQDLPIEMYGSNGVGPQHDELEATPHPPPPPSEHEPPHDRPEQHGPPFGAERPRPPPPPEEHHKPHFGDERPHPPPAHHEPPSDGEHPPPPPPDHDGPPFGDKHPHGPPPPPEEHHKPHFGDERPHPPPEHHEPPSDGEHPPPPPPDHHGPPFGDKHPHGPPPFEGEHPPPPPPPDREPPHHKPEHHGPPSDDGNPHGPPHRGPPFGGLPHHGPPSDHHPFAAWDNSPEHHRPHFGRHGPHRQPLLVTVATVLLLLIFTLAVAKVVRSKRDQLRKQRKRQNRLARCEERRNRVAYRCAAAQHRWSSWWSQFRQPQSTADYDEKRTRIVNQESHLEGVMQSEIRDLRRAHELVGEIMRAEQDRQRLYHEANFGSSRHNPIYEVGESNSASGSMGTSTLPEYQSPPPSYEAELEGEMSVVDGFRYTPSNTESTPDSSVVDCNSRISFETGSAGGLKDF